MANEIPRILVVDDEEELLANTVETLELGGYQCLKARNGVEALGLMQRVMPDLVVSDISMPHMDGYDLYTSVRSNTDWLTLPFIFLTGHGEAHEVRQGYAMGVDMYLTKPVVPDDLLVAVESRLRRVTEIRDAASSSAEIMKQRIMNYLGHELRTPLAYLYGGLAMVVQDGHVAIQGDLLDEMLSEMQRGTNRLVTLIEDIMLLIAIDSGVIAQEVSRYGELTLLAHILSAACEKNMEKANAKNIKIALMVPRDLVVKGMSNRLANLFSRLVENAVKFTPKGGHVWVRAEPAGDQVLVSVRDNGIGIPPEKLRMLFQRFNQVNRDKQEQQGMGIGLAIASGLVDVHGGKIRVESQPGEGSTFTVELPLEPYDISS